MADFESIKKDDESNTVKNSSIELDNSMSTETKPKTNMFAWKLGMVFLIGLIAIVYTTVDVEITNTDQVVALEPIIVDPRLHACNSVVSGEPTEDFSICLSAANDGEVLAIKRLIWGYSRSNEFQNWPEVFKWLKALPRKDESTQLLMYAIVHFMADTDEIREDSETGISRLVAKNYPPANILLAAIYALEENVLPPTSNIQWLLERDANEKFNAITPTQLLLIYANGFVGKIDIEKATKYLEQVAQRNFPINANNIAWFLSTLDSNPFTTQEYALSLVKQVTDDPEHSQNPVYIDTLAASLASNGLFVDAVKAQQLAIELLDKSELSAKRRNTTKIEFENRLALYSVEKALVEESISVDKKVFFDQMKTRTVDFLFRKFFIVVDVSAPTISNELTIDNNEPIEIKTETETTSAPISDMSKN